LDTRRLKEIEQLSEFLAEKNTRRQRDDNGEPESIILLGDFNIFDTKDKTFKALQKNDFTVPVIGQTNLGADKYFDQIAFHDPRNLLWPKQRDLPIKDVPRKGIFRFLECVFREQDVESYDREMLATCGDKYKRAKDKKAFYKKWRTFQMSDHCPLWVELRIDFSDPFIAVAGGLARHTANRNNSNGNNSKGNTVMSAKTNTKTARAKPHKSTKKNAGNLPISRPVNTGQDNQPSGCQAYLPGPVDDSAAAVQFSRITSPLSGDKSLLSPQLRSGLTDIVPNPCRLRSSAVGLTGELVTPASAFVTVNRR